VVREIKEQSNGLSYKLNLEKNSEGVLDLENLTGTKVFQCATCEEYKDFEEDVAVLDIGPWYVSTLKKDVLWFNCYDCTSLGVDISQIKIDEDYE
jgi:hypothetical protein